MESKKNTSVASLARLGFWRGKVSDDGCVERKNNTRRAKKAHPVVWKGKAGDDNDMFQYAIATSLLISE